MDELNNIKPESQGAAPNIKPINTMADFLFPLKLWFMVVLVVKGPQSQQKVWCIYKCQAGNEDEHCTSNSSCKTNKKS